MKHKEDKYGNTKYADNDWMAVQGVGVLLKVLFTQIQGGITSCMAEQKEKQQAAAYGHYEFFTD